MCRLVAECCSLEYNFVGDMPNQARSHCERATPILTGYAGQKTTKIGTVKY